MNLTEALGRYNSTAARQDVFGEFMAAALTGLCANPDLAGLTHPDEIARAAFAQADACVRLLVEEAEHRAEAASAERLI